MADPEPAGGDASYVFRVRFHLDPTDPAVALDPSAFETTLHRAAAPPGEDGWLYFRDNLWRGEVNDEAHLRTLATETLGVPVDAVSFRELRTDEPYLAALEDAIAANLSLFRADDVAAVLTKYFGSSIHVE